MKKALLVLMVLVLAFAFTACAKQSVAPIPAPKTETETKVVVDQTALKEFREKFPVISNAKQAVALGLHLTVLTKSLDVLNLQNKEKENPWKWEPLEAGTKVWADGDEIPRYIWACLNLIYVPTTTVTKVTPVVPTPIVTPLKHGRVVMAGWFWRTLLGAIIALAILLAILLGLLLLFYLFRWPWRVTRQLFGKDKPMPQTILVTTPAPDTSAPEPKLKKGTSASAPIPVPNPAPASRPKSATTTPAHGSIAWDISASPKNVEIRIRNEKFKSISINLRDGKETSVMVYKE
jgi:hypothetical protein